MESIIKLAKALQESSAVIFTGAGVSTNSGIADFRSKDGFYSKYHEEDLSVEHFFDHTDAFYHAFNEKFGPVFAAQPNDTHLILGQLEKEGYIKGIITQNVDRLHQKGGSKNVIEFHGNIYEYDLIDITNRHELKYRIINYDIPYHKVFFDHKFHYRVGQYIYKPQVVLYGEAICKWSESVRLAQSSDLHIIMGTSYLVSPFNMISGQNHHKDLNVFVINKEPIEYHGPCTQIIGDTSDILQQVQKILKGF